ncbi:MAG: hypothetical protein KAS96_11835 [Planctomycetes bacterium]|nr:hypothetical protein [Planctomycetota bacterium]
MAEWQISKSQGQCFGTAKPIAPGEEFFAALVEVEDTFERRDYCCQYWNEHKPRVYCYWKSRYPDPDKKKQLLIDDDMLVAFFERLAEETDQDKINFRFVLTLILMRKRKLKYNSSRIVDSREIWTLKVAGEKRTVDVINPHLNEEQIEQLSSQMGEIMQVDIEQ